MGRLSDWLRRVQALDQEGEPGLWSWSGCVTLMAVCVSAASVLMGALSAVACNAEGLLLVCDRDPAGLHPAGGGYEAGGEVSQ